MEVPSRIGQELYAAWNEIVNFGMDSDTKDAILTGVRSVESAELKVVENGNMWKVKRSESGKVVLTTQELNPSFWSVYVALSDQSITIFPPGLGASPKMGVTPPNRGETLWEFWEHNAMFLTRARTRTARSCVSRTNHLATASTTRVKREAITFYLLNSFL